MRRRCAVTNMSDMTRSMRNPTGYLHAHRTFWIFNYHIEVSARRKASFSNKVRSHAGGGHQPRGTASATTKDQASHAAMHPSCCPRYAAHDRRDLRRNCDGTVCGAISRVVLEQWVDQVLGWIFLCALPASNKLSHCGKRRLLYPIHLSWTDVLGSLRGLGEPHFSISALRICKSVLRKGRILDGRGMRDRTACREKAAVYGGNA